MKLKEWLLEQNECLYDFNSIEEKWLNFEIVDTYYQDKNKFNSYEIISKYSGVCNSVAIITNGKRYYEAAIFETHGKHGWGYSYNGSPRLSLKINWIKYYGLSKEEIEKIKAKKETNKKPKKYVPIDLSYKDTEEWKKYNGVLKESSTFNETNDCVPVAVTLATGLPYAKVHQAFKDAGRKFRKGTFQHQIRDALKALGFKMTKLPEFKRQYSWSGNRRSSTGYSTKGLIGNLDSNKNYLIGINRHMLAAVNGQILDWSRNRKKFVEYVAILEKYEKKNN